MNDSELIVALLCAISLVLLLWLNISVTKRIRATDEPRWRKNALVASVWVVPLVGALGARSELRAMAPVADTDSNRLPKGFVTEAAPEQIVLQGAPAFSLLSNMGLTHGLPFLEWQTLDAWIASIEDPDLQREARAQGARAWLLHLRDALGPHFHLHESDRALVLSSLEDVVIVATAGYVASTRKRIERLLAGVARFDDHEKSILLIMDDDEIYYDYVGAFYPDEGEFAFSSGMFIHAGIPHFLAKRADLLAIEPVIAHEMTHSAVLHLDLPTWLNEGLAVNTEHRLKGTGLPNHTPQELRQKHLAFWGDAQIQEFWSGESFFRPDDGSMLSYELGRIMVEHMARDWASFARFATNAQRGDAGAQAARDVLGIDLGAYACALLERPSLPQWSPRPETWAQAQA